MTGFPSLPVILENILIMKKVILLILIIGITIDLAFAQKLDLDKWTYIEADSSRQKWGDWAEPDWLRYFGLDFMDLNKDGYKDIIAGRYFYINPGGDMQGQWIRNDLGMNVDGYLYMDIDGDEYADDLSLKPCRMYLV